MPSIFSTIGYIIEANIINSTNNTTITNGVIVCNRPEKNDSIFINFVFFDLLINSDCVYFINGKFVYNKKPNDTSQELQVDFFLKYDIFFCCCL